MNIAVVEINGKFDQVNKLVSENKKIIISLWWFKQFFCFFSLCFLLNINLNESSSNPYVVGEFHFNNRKSYYFNANKLMVQKEM
jgi:hypothetical protein